MDLLLCEDEFSSRFLPIVDEEDNKSRNQQYWDDDGCDDCAFRHDMDKTLGSLRSTQPTYLS